MGGKKRGDKKVVKSINKRQTKSKEYSKNGASTKIDILKIKEGETNSIVQKFNDNAKILNQYFVTERLRKLFDNSEKLEIKGIHIGVIKSMNEIFEISEAINYIGDTSNWKQLSLIGRYQKLVRYSIDRNGIDLFSEETKKLNFRFLITNATTELLLKSLQIVNLILSDIELKVRIFQKTFLNSQQRIELDNLQSNLKPTILDRVKIIEAYFQSIEGHFEVDTVRFFGELGSSDEMIPIPRLPKWPIPRFPFPRPEDLVIS